jgi:hypothetical protein
MAMPTNHLTQSISFLQMQNEYGGSNPIHFSEYYRSGSYVPNVVYRQALGWVARGYAAGTNGVEERTITATGVVSVKWIFGGVEISTTTAGLGNTVVNIGGTNYATGSSALNVSGTDKVGRPYTQRNYPIFRWEYTSTGFPVNTAVPSSGTISLFKFYNGSNT